MKTILFSILFALLLPGFAQEKPRLVIGIVVDQMRQDYLFRFGTRMGDGGFNRLIKEGAQFKNAHYNYTPTYTAPGHASIYTGTTPSNHGIIGNTWYSRKKGLKVYCVSDLSVMGVGGSDRHGQMSPKNLKVTTITDELLQTHNFRSKVVGVSIKDRGSILPAGHNPTGSYWLEGNTGNFITSSYYMHELPDWVQAFNQEKKPAKYLNQVWEPLYAIDQYKESTADDVSYERALPGKEASAFPYDLKSLVKHNGMDLIKTTPYGNTLVMDMALAAIEGEDLGQDEITDFLALSFSSTDYIGHAFGPNSVELADTYLRLDQEIERLLTYLDKAFKGEYLIFLTADHGVAPVPLYLNDRKMPGGYTDAKNISEDVAAFLHARFGEAEWVLNISNDQIFLDRSLIKEKKLSLSDVQQELKEFLLTYADVSEVYTTQDLMRRNATDRGKKLLENGFNSTLSGDVVVKFNSGFIDGGYGKAGTTHGSGYRYDTHVPMLFFGREINAGTYVRPVEITDIAPTLSMLLNVSLPSAATGKPLLELFE